MLIGLLGISEEDDWFGLAGRGGGTGEQRKSLEVDDAGLTDLAGRGGDSKELGLGGKGGGESET